MIFDEGGLSSGWCFIRVVSHEGGVSSGWSLMRVIFIRVVSHQGGISSGWSFIRVASNLHDLSSGVYLSGLIIGVPL